jgi:exopolysaccharide production protein ExoQ
LILTAAQSATAPWDRRIPAPHAASRDLAEVDSPVTQSIWTQVFAWVALLPTLFITVSGRIQPDDGPVAFRFTAMDEDSLERRILRVACSALIVLLISTRFRAILRACARAKLFLILPFLAFASVAWSQNPTHTLVDAANLALTTLFAAFLYVRYPGRRLIEFLTFCAAVSLLLSIFLVVAVPSIGIDAYQQDAWRGVFGQRNNCAAVCALYLVLALHDRARTFGAQFLRATVIVLSLVFIVMSGSRTGWGLALLAFALTALVRFAARMRSLDRLAFLMAVAIPATLLIYFAATNFNTLLAIMDRDPTLTQRTVIWAEVIPSILKQPWLGYGYSSFWTGLHGESSRTVLVTRWMEGQAQNGYLDVLLQLGLLGLAPLLYTFVRAFLHAGKAFERLNVPPAVLLATALLPMVLMENVGESSFLLPLGIPWFYALIAFLILTFSTRPLAEAT